MATTKPITRISTGVRIRASLGALALVAGLAACATHTPQPGESERTQSRRNSSNESQVAQTGTPTDESPGQALVVVRLSDRFELPRAVALDFTSEGDSALQSSVAMLQRGLSGQYGDYPMLLKLETGRFELQALRIAGLGRNAPGAMIARLDQSIEIQPGETRYIGRLILTDTEQDGKNPTVTIEDHYEEDSLLARSIARTLRNIEIVNASQVSDTLTGPTGQATQLTIKPIGPRIFNMISDNQRPDFRRFLHAAHPRVFAVGDDGAAGFASGKRAVELALERCSRRGNGASCRILAIDDAVVVNTDCGGSTASQPAC